MAQQQERYLIGPGLRDKLREVITRVDGTSLGNAGDGKIPVAHQSISRIAAASDGSVRLGTFSGAWPLGGTAVVTLVNTGVSTDRQTVTATNATWPITQSGYADLPCIVGSDSGEWYLLSPECEAATATMIIATTSVSVVTGVTSVLNTNTCSITNSLQLQQVTVVASSATVSIIRIKAP